MTNSHFDFNHYEIKVQKKILNTKLNYRLAQKKIFKSYFLYVFNGIFKKAKDLLIPSERSE